MKKLCLYFSLLLLPGTVKGQHIAEILEYQPAPGQFINVENIGRPEAAEALSEEKTTLVSLGACGGYLSFRSAEPIYNDLKHPYGVDFVLFGNATEELAEPGAVYVMPDKNENGLADEEWFLIAPPQYYLSESDAAYRIQYTNPHAEKATSVPWSDSHGLHGFVYANQFHNQPYYPQEEFFPEYPRGSIQFNSLRIHPDLDSSNGILKSLPLGWGLADNIPRNVGPEPGIDNPYTKDIEGMGGDGIDISWAINAAGEYAELESISFVKIATATNENLGALGEMSTEFSGIHLVSPDAEWEEKDYFAVLLSPLPRHTTIADHHLEYLGFHNGKPDSTLLLDIKISPETYQLNNGQLHFEQEAEYEIKAALRSHPEVFQVRKVRYNSTVSTHSSLQSAEIKIYPNPTRQYLHLEILNSARISLYDMAGKQVMMRERQERFLLDLSQLEAAIYILALQYDTGRIAYRKIILQ